MYSPLCFRSFFVTVNTIIVFLGQISRRTRKEIGVRRIGVNYREIVVINKVVAVKVVNRANNIVNIKIVKVVSEDSKVSSKTYTLRFIFLISFILSLYAIVVNSVAKFAI
jgi:hypothetical protein